MATMKELAAGIAAHLKGFEADPAINVRGRENLLRFYNAYCSSGGGRIYVQYISYQGTSHLSKAEAESYLAWLDAGNIGQHYKALAALTPHPAA